MSPNIEFSCSVEDKICKAILIRAKLRDKFLKDRAERTKKHIANKDIFELTSCTKLLFKP